MRRFFVPAEREQVEATRPELAKEASLTFWTLKEPYIKAIGRGLAQSLTSFSFDLEPLSIHFQQGMEDDSASWLFRRYRPTSGHLMALPHPDPDRVEIGLSMMDTSRLCLPF